MVVMRECANPKCGKEFSASRKDKIFCSSRCYDAARRPPKPVEKKECCWCGEDFSAKRKDKIYCSKKCIWFAWYSWAYPTRRREFLQRGRSWRQRNKKAVAAACKSYAIAHPKEMKAYCLAYRLRNQEKVKARAAAYQIANPDQVRVNNHRRLSRKRNAPGDCSVKDLKIVLSILGRTCLHPNSAECCGGVTIDHVVPLSLGGSNRSTNLQPLCHSHNSRKSNCSCADYRTPDQIRQILVAFPHP